MAEEKIYIKYDAVYEKIQLLKQFLNEEVISITNNKFSEISQIISEMDGKTCEELKESSKLTLEKTTTFSNTLIGLLDFIEKSTKDMEKDDLERATKILIEGEK